MVKFGKTNSILLQTEQPTSTPLWIIAVCWKCSAHSTSLLHNRRCIFLNSNKRMFTVKLRLIYSCIPFASICSMLFGLFAFFSGRLDCMPAFALNSSTYGIICDNWSFKMNTYHRHVSLLDEIIFLDLRNVVLVSFLKKIRAYIILSDAK